MSGGTAHRCARYRSERREGPWRHAGLLREREVERIKVCPECGRERIGRFRKLFAVEREGDPCETAPDGSIRHLARRLEVILKGRGRIRGDTLLRHLGGVRGEASLESLAPYSPIRLVYHRRGGNLHLHELLLLNARSLTELARPGAEAKRREALETARRETAALVHPEAQAIAEHLTVEEATAMDMRVIRSLAALARLVESGESRPARVFATEVLGHSKALVPIRSRLERIVGPLDRLGIRDTVSHVLVGGAGRLRLPGGELDVGRFRSIGLADRDVFGIVDAQFPAGGIFIVENLTPFQACLDHMAGRSNFLFVWSAGFPGRAVSHLVRQATLSGAPIRVWCDLDLGGVRIARVVLRDSDSIAEPVLMDVAIVREAQTAIPLTPDQIVQIESDIVQHPAEALANTLRAILTRGTWIEQETLIDRIAQVLD
jgi:hypothetical protein